MNEDKSRQRLGRGLASLIGAGAMSPARSANGFAPAEPGERKLPLARLTPNPKNPRRHFDEGELADLAASVKKHGVVQPILVRPKGGSSADFEIVAGERRWRAATAAGLSEVPVVVRDIGDRETLEIAIIENVQRSDLSALEEAQAYQMLIDEHGYTQADLGGVLGRSRSHVANTLRLLKLPEGVRDMLIRGELTAGHARTTVSSEDPDAFAREIVARRLSVREAEEMARGPEDEDGEALPDPATKTKQERGAKKAGKATSAPVSPAGGAKDDDTRALERLLSETLGTRVEISVSRKGGDIRIDYASLEQLDEICRLLQARQGARAEPRVRSL